MTWHQYICVPSETFFGSSRQGPKVRSDSYNARQFDVKTIQLICLDLFQMVQVDRFMVQVDRFFPQTVQKKHTNLSPPFSHQLNNSLLGTS